jgi:hypothetical protein
MPNPDDFNSWMQDVVYNLMMAAKLESPFRGDGSDDRTLIRQMRGYDIRFDAMFENGVDAHEVPAEIVAEHSIYLEPC